MSANPLHEFDVFVQRDERDLRVSQAALLFAADHCPAVDAGESLEFLDGLANRVRRLRPESLADQIDALQTVLIHEENFSGNAAQYYDPRNSFLNEVLARRLGIPITLSVVWLDICEQLGWPFHGIGLPGHFIIGCVRRGIPVLIDPFGGGRLLRLEDCERIVSQVFGRPVKLAAEHFQPIGKKAILVRMLNNLRGIYLQSEAWSDAVRVLSRLMALEGETTELLREMSFVSSKLATLN